MDFLGYERAVGRFRFGREEVDAAKFLFDWLKSGRCVPIDEGMGENYGGEFSRHLRVLSNVLFAKGDSIFCYLPGQFGRLPFSSEGIQVHVESFISFHSSLPIFMLGKSSDENVFKGLVAYGEFCPHAGDDIVNRLGAFANPPIVGVQSMMVPHPDDRYKPDVRLYGIGGIHDLSRIHRLYWFVKDMYNDLSRFCSLTSKEMDVLFRDARSHENVVIRDLSRERYERTIDEICAPLKEKMGEEDFDAKKLLAERTDDDSKDCSEDGNAKGGKKDCKRRKKVDRNNRGAMQEKIS